MKENIVSSDKFKTILDVSMRYKQVEKDNEKILSEAKKDGEANQQQSFPLRPSAALKPELDLYLDLVNYYEPNTIPKDDMDGRVHILLASGHHLEDFIVKQINRVHKVVDTNERVQYATIDGPDGPIPLSGEYDLTFIDSDTGELMLGDSKTSSDYAFKRGLPKEEHFAQLNLYMHSREFKDKGIKKARLYYYNKNNSDYDTYEFEYNEKLALETIARFQKVMNMYMAKTPPAQEHFWGQHWKAAYGSYRTYLHADYKAKQAERIQISLTDIEFNAVVKRPKTEAIYLMATKYGNNILKSKSGDTAFLNLTTKGLVVRLTEKDGFTNL